MRRRLQQVGSKLVAHGGLVLGLFATLVYLFTMDRSVSWWDCGEFIATGWTLGVGHPPGAPTYQLISHLFMLLSFGNPMWVAPLSNAFSALCGGITVALLYLTLRRLGCRPVGSAVGALCYLFCDTAWFSAVESEVYALAMLVCALQLYLALGYRRSHNPRLLLLMALLAGLGMGVHMMTLLALPAAVLLIVAARPSVRALHLPGVALFFLLGLTPYAVIPLRAAANPAINECDPSTPERFVSYMKRDMYEHAPLYPRMWRERDSANWSDWNLGLDGLAGNMVYAAGYQLGYMYLRYFMYNFIGRENLHWHCIVVFVLPFLLGLWGLWSHRRRSRLEWWAVMLLFLFGGVLLNIYLNHPCYEPRSRDYVYVLSFYAFALWIGLGADSLPRRRWLTALALLAPLTMAVGNWADHDRHRCHSVHDIAAAHLDACGNDAILFTLGDNDTFPLWYLQQVEGHRTDVSVHNLGYTGWSRLLTMVDDNFDHRPIYVTHYFYQRYAHLFPGGFRCRGFCWQMVGTPGADVHFDASATDWNITRGEYLPSVSRHFLDIWRQNTGLPVPRR